MPETRIGQPYDSADAVKIGEIRRELRPVTLFRLNSGEENDGVESTVRLKLRNLHKALEVQIACGVPGLRAASFPASPGTIQLTGVTRKFESNNGVFVRPAFQDPAGPVNTNVPLPENLPFGWEFTTNTRDVEIEVVIPAASWDATAVDGLIQVDVTVEYNGNWWDADTIRRMLSQVVLEDPGEIIEIGTQGGEG